MSAALRLDHHAGMNEATCRIYETWSCVDGNGSSRR